MSVANNLSQADIFDELTTTQLELIASICTEKYYQAGDTIFEENTSGSEIYIIESGEVNIQVDPAMLGSDSSGPHTIATLRRGQSFGEVALVDQGLRSASARCAKPDTHLIIIPREKLMMLCDMYPQLGYKLMRNLAADLAMKIRHTDMQVREQLTWTQRDK
ncbi:cyclic nucleotide-binding domain-containing protein [Phototrophicus methaneseepsis]|uniref:Cyclic nucleotide-binding domain-containing protein n=1 Tax=Phototrophicus methaneseepsis TaxID=2710758 RepID=A0A7S8E5R7_9CHLR|nr:cyclic nucleotide-binding domain-containing protein [Phototrophicus methaneseepsis]QPC80898.1 cyclic nucleotide-binding domain-containing protein [Phototrophicus methaneseepsis]